GVADQIAPATVAQQIDDGTLRHIDDERMQFREREPAPRRAQYGKPRGAVPEVRDGARKRQQVKHDRSLPEWIDIGRPEGTVAPRQLGDDVDEVTASLYQDRDLAGGRLREARRSD